MQYNRIVLNEPHASIEVLYDNQLSFWAIDARFINDIVLKWTDWHTDYLFHGYSRFHLPFFTNWRSDGCNSLANRNSFRKFALTKALSRDIETTSRCPSLRKCFVPNYELDNRLTH